MPNNQEISGIRDELLWILQNYGHFRENTPFSGSNAAALKFAELKSALESSDVVRDRPFLRVVASYGKGNWATIPWVSLLDSRETNSTQRGVYVVFLFREDGQGVYIKLAQGVTDAQKSYGQRAASVLDQRARELRTKLPQLKTMGFDLSGSSDLGTSHPMAKLYEASTVASKYYPATNLPDDESILSDLDHLLAAYQHLAESGQSLQDSRTEELALVGTWRTISSDLNSVAYKIKEKGGWASPWSFRIKHEAKSRLSKPFNLYINAGGGQIVARARVRDFACSETAQGIVSPWPELTSPEDTHKSSFGPGPHEAIKTWLKIEHIEFIDPFRASKLQPAEGLSSSASVLNQNAFGYVIDDAIVSEDNSSTAQPIRGQETSSEPIVAPTMEWLSEQTLLPSSILGKMIDTILGKSPQILLSGPPGTSKTWVAERLALFLAGGRRSAVRLVQFHPSYTYESFIEGIRPQPSSQGIKFELTPGVLVETVRDMERRGHLNDAAHPYVLILDEFNRANLPRVLGELMYLFEYRQKSIRLQYSAEFMLPTNLLFIGTMNTADRSIRSIDSALRRRFDTFELLPDPEILSRHLMKFGPDFSWVSSGLRLLNAALEEDIDRHHTIGHSFFMSSGISIEDVREIWSRRIFPLIEEYFFDQPDIARTYTCERFWKPE